MRIAFLGAGRWGMTLAIQLARKGFEIRLWEKDATRRKLLISERIVPELPETVRIPDSVVLSGDWDEVLSGSKVLVLALPSQVLRLVLRDLNPMIPGDLIIVSVMKGLEVSTGKRISEIVREFLPKVPFACLTGPGIPFDVAAGDPTTLLAASTVEADARWVRDLFAGGNLRIYSTGDLTGAEFGGALKNVVAIAAGVSDGLGLGMNAKAALLTRGLREMIRIGVTQGANPLTFAGLSGIGDLMVTAFSSKSRNYRFGLAIAKGVTVSDALCRLGGTVEGYSTCQAAKQLTDRHNVDAPIISQLYRVLYKAASIKDSIKNLLERTLKDEF